MIRPIMVYNCPARFDKGHTGLNSDARVETDGHCTIVYSNVTDNVFLGIKTKNACTSF